MRARHNIAEVYPESQFGNDHKELLIDGRELSNFVVPTMAPDAFSKLVQRQKSHDLSKYGRFGIHWALLDVLNQK